MTKGDEAVISYNEETGNMFGTLKMASGSSFAMEKCDNGHVWKEFDVSTFIPDKAIKIGNSTQKSVRTVTDNTTIVTYSVMFYFTADFASVTSDISGYVDQVKIK